jgi:hypothetical protein
MPFLHAFTLFSGNEELESGKKRNQEINPTQLSYVTRGSDPRKIALVQLLWRRTTVSQVWLSERLAMRSAANVSQLLRRTARERINRKLPKRLVAFVKRAMRESIESRFAH